MRPLSRLAAAIAAVLFLVASPLAAQRGGKPVQRPKLRDVTDTNDAQAYYEAGLQRFRDDPGYAADAFYWAARLNKSALRARQVSARGGDIRCEPRGDRVLIAGQAALVLEGTLRY